MVNGNHALYVFKYFQTERLLSLPHAMYQDFIDLTVSKDAQAGFSSQSVTFQPKE